MTNQTTAIDTRYAYFELHRTVDGLIYQFDRQLRADGTIGYKRRDLELWILFKPEFGWISYDEATQSVTGRPWNMLPRQQSNVPPEDEWVTKKGSKSYVYTLAYHAPRDDLPKVIPDAR